MATLHIKPAPDDAEELRAFAEEWLYHDTRSAFPELPDEMIREIARQSAEDTARELAKIAELDADLI